MVFIAYGCLFGSLLSHQLRESGRIIEPKGGLQHLQRLLSYVPAHTGSILCQFTETFVL